MAFFGLFGNGPKDTTSYTASTGKTPGVGDLAPEGFDNSQDSLTQATRALTNYQAQAGKKTYEQGGRTTQEGIDTTHPAVDFFRKLVSGDPNELASIMQPQTDAITQQFSQIRKMFQSTGSRGGGTTSTIVQSPYEQIRTLTDLIARERSNAAGQLGQLGTTVAGIGNQQQSIGLNAAQGASRDLLARRGQNLEESGQNKNLAAQIIQALL